MQHRWECELVQRIRNNLEEFFFLIFIYLFIWLRWVLTAAGGLLQLRLKGSLVAARGLLSCGMHVGSNSLARD